MGTKRPNNSVVLAQEPKRSKSDLIAYTNRDKALLESVSVVARRRTKKILKKFNEYYNVYTIIQGVRRTSNLQAPIMQLEGHEGEIFTTEFHPEGEMLLSSGFDRQIRE